MSPLRPEDRHPVSPEEIDEARLDDWRVLAGRLQARFDTGSFATGVDLVVRIGTAADAGDHHPDVDLRYTHVIVSMHSHDVDAVTARDIRLARAISSIAADLGLTPRPELLPALEQ